VFGNNALKSETSPTPREGMFCLINIRGVVGAKKEEESCGVCKHVGGVEAKIILLKKN
jgi:hypothetical protein